MPTLHFSIGPVQGFIAETRRTRDLSASSFLLSWLAAKAMLAVMDAGGRIVFPDAERDPLIAAMKEQRGAPYIGSVPNRFKVEVADAGAGARAAGAVREAWQSLAADVWESFVASHAARGRDTERIWKRQVEGFWDITWVHGTPIADAVGRSDDGAWLDMRKNWRSHYPVEPEGGDHCQLMGLYQEISGYVRSRDPGERERQDAFWAGLRNDCRIGALNLRSGERLSAIALIKRLFPILPATRLRSRLGWVPAPRDFPLRNWPSVSYMAALPWLREAWRLAPAACGAYREYIEAATGGWQPIDEDHVDGISGERATRIIKPESPDHERFLSLDGQLFHVDAIHSADLDTFRRSDAETVSAADLKARAEDAAKKLETLQAEIGRHAPRPGRPGRAAPSEFYAVLLGDGDAIGRNLRTGGGEAKARAGLARFALEVPELIARHSGVTIYAGGDDALALVPLDDAIPAAVDLNACYRRAFDGEPDWTFSAAIVFAQYRIPMRAVLREAHAMLDRVAKDGNGRDSLAISVFKPGGQTFSWTSTWDNGAAAPGERIEPPNLLQDFARNLQQKQDFTTGFFYNLRARYAPLFKASALNGSRVGEHMRRLLIAEFKDSRGKGEAPAQVDRLMPVALPWRRSDGVIERHTQFSFDAGLIARFLAEEGRWFMAVPKSGGAA